MMPIWESKSPKKMLLALLHHQCELLIQLVICSSQILSGCCVSRHIQMTVSCKKVFEKCLTLYYMFTQTDIFLLLQTFLHTLHT